MFKHPKKEGVVANLETIGSYATFLREFYGENDIRTDAQILDTLALNTRDNLDYPEIMRRLVRLEEKNTKTLPLLERQTPKVDTIDKDRKKKNIQSTIGSIATGLSLRVYSPEAFGYISDKILKSLALVSLYFGGH